MLHMYILTFMETITYYTKLILPKNYHFKTHGDKQLFQVKNVC